MWLTNKEIGTSGLKVSGNSQGKNLEPEELMITRRHV
jgi:hypothetical protein